MAIPVKRDLEVTGRVLTSWCSQKMTGATDVTVYDVRPPRQGQASDTLLFRVRWRDANACHDREMVARIETAPDLHVAMGTDVLRLARVVEALGPCRTVPVPEVLYVESDPAVLGRPFFVMGKVEGRVPPDTPTYHASGWVADLTAAERARMWANGIRAMAEIHKLDWRAFSFLARSERPGIHDYVDYLVSWYAWAARGRSVEIVERALDYLTSRLPADAEVTLVWNDARPGNLMFADDLSVAAVLDWEVAQLGTPEIDLAGWLFMEDIFSVEAGVSPLKGVPDRRSVVRIYEEALGRPVEDLFYYDVVIAVKTAIIFVVMLQGDAVYDNPATRRLTLLLNAPAARSVPAARRKGTTGP